jgi:hypothetical protein
MPSTILSSLGEPVLYSNSLATITDNWIVVRASHLCAQSVLSIESILEVKTLKTSKLYYFASGVGCLLIAFATSCSKQSNAVILLFVLTGIGLLTANLITGRAAIGFVVGSELVQTAYAPLSETATLLAAVRAAQDGWRRVDEPVYEFLSWVRAYLTLLV